jgi:hypothetical protein
VRRYLIAGIVVVATALVVVGAAALWRSNAARRGGGGVASSGQASEAAAVLYTAKISDVPYEPADVQAQVAPYTIKADLSNIDNLALLGKFTPEQAALLAKNAFFAAPTQEQQLFFIYEQNDYLNIPSFITTDSVLQVYHVFFDFTLRRIEGGKLYDVLVTLTDTMVAESDIAASQMRDPKWKKAAAMNQVYFAVPASILERKVELPTADQGAILAKELELVHKAEGRTQSALFPWIPDYSQFKVRGHYTRSEKLKRYFRAMMWYGYQPLPVDWKDDDGNDGPAWPQIRQALLLTLMLYNSKIDGKPALETWERIYEPTVFYVGAADDLTPHQYKAVIDKVYGKDAGYADLQDEAKLKLAYDELRKLPKPRIDVQMLGMPHGRMLKFMGQRYIADSEMFQRLVSWPERPFPKGLDVMAVLGSERAADILDNVYKEPQKWGDYVPQRQKLMGEFDQTTLDTWQSNLYWGWLWGLDSLIEPFGEGYPSFMANQAWLDKSLNTSLAGWAELRHDTILYAKQSGAECGDGEEPAPTPKGYVEPNVEFYSRLLWLANASKTGLDQRGLLDSDIRARFEEFGDLLTFLRNVSVKELTNQPLTKAEYDQIRLCGANLEWLTLSVVEGGGSSWWEITSEADKDMAVVADVHTSMDKCLEEGVGHVDELFVVVPIEGKLYLTRGAIFSYYEFTHPLTDRLTDEKWQKMLKEGTAPKPPIWTDSFLTGPKTEIPIPRLVRSTGC